MGVNATKIQNITNEESKSRFTVDIATQSKIIVDLVNKISQQATSTINTGIKNTTSITIENTNIGGSLNIENTTLSIDSIIDVQIFENDEFSNLLKNALTDQFQQTISDQFKNKLTPETIAQVRSIADVKSDSSPAIGTSENINVIDKHNEIVSSFVDKSKTKFNDKSSNELVQAIKQNIKTTINNNSNIYINNVNINNDLNINYVNLSVLSKITLNTIIKNKLVSTFIDNIQTQFKDVAVVTGINDDASKISTESDNKSSTTSNLDGIIKGLQALFAMPVNLLAILVFGIVAVIAILGIVFVLTIKYLTASPETLKILGDVAKKIPGKGKFIENKASNLQNIIPHEEIILPISNGNFKIKTTASTELPSSVKGTEINNITNYKKGNELDDNSLNQINKLLSNSKIILETSIY